MRRVRASALAIAMIWLLAASEATPVPAGSFKLWGMAYGAFRDGQSPGAIYPSKANIVEDMKILRSFTRRIRTYSVSNNEQLIPALARKSGVEAYAGAHIGSDAVANSEEIERLVEACESARCAGLVVGNEVLLHGSLLVDDLIALLRSVKNDPRVIRRGMPVGYADTDTILLAHPQLATEVDFLLVNIHPYWDGIAVEDAAESVVARWLDVESTYPGIKVIVGETGWPTAGDPSGDAIPSEPNQQRFLNDFAQLALERNVSYFFFEAFDEKWKGDASGVEAESHWGLWYSDRTMKPRRFFETPPPLIEILQVPSCWDVSDRMETIAGQVRGIRRDERNSYRIVIYAGTNAWYVQPLVNDPLTSIRGKLSWSNRIFLGDAYAAVLVPEGCSPSSPLSPLPPPDGAEFPGIPDPGCAALAVAVRECE